MYLFSFFLGFLGFCKKINDEKRQNYLFLPFDFFFWKKIHISEGIPANKYVWAQWSLTVQFFCIWCYTSYLHTYHTDKFSNKLRVYYSMCTVHLQHTSTVHVWNHFRTWVRSFRTFYVSDRDPYISNKTEDCDYMAQAFRQKHILNTYLYV